MSADNTENKKPWSGRFLRPTDAAVEAFTSSITFDSRLYPYDIAGSIAHCRTLAKAGVITDVEAGALIEGLKKVCADIESNHMAFEDRLEDIHMHIEDRLFMHVGDLAKKLHTGRSRNDQVAVDVRLYLKEETTGIISGLARLREALVDLAERKIDTVMPGYTHLQRAQPILFSHHIMAYYEMFTRDCARFSDALSRMDVMPLGSAALAGTTYPIDRHYTAGLLGFSQISENSIDAVSDRDFMMETMSAAGICMIHLSRFSEELVLWSSSEFSFISLDDAFCTGSSIMPQKKNPDIPELVRGKTGRVIGDLTALFMLMKSLPLAYNRDMQEDKPLVFDSMDTLFACIDIYSRLVPNIRVNNKTTKLAAQSGYLNATDLADWLATAGMPFRQAHECAGRAVAYAIKQNKELHELSLDELRAFSPLIKDDIFDALSLDTVISRRRSYGGTARQNVIAAISRAKEALEAVNGSEICKEKTGE
ncbi:MAG: argininosuccinate lyase [Deltaproteobacteria bacterium]|nr:argininosuccinate lyase [Deltaproteobacteria bacterium]